MAPVASHLLAAPKHAASHAAAALHDMGANKSVRVTDAVDNTRASDQGIFGSPRFYRVPTPRLTGDDSLLD